MMADQQYCSSQHTGQRLLASCCPAQPRTSCGCSALLASNWRLWTLQVCTITWQPSHQMAASLLQPPSHQMSRFALTHHSQTRYALLAAAAAAAAASERQRLKSSFVSNRGFGSPKCVICILVLVMQVFLQAVHASILLHLQLPAELQLTYGHRNACLSDTINNVLHSVCRYMKSGMTSRMLTRALPR